MIELSEDQCRQLNGSEVVAVDPRTNKQYVLVPKTVYDQLRRPADDDARNFAPLLADLDSEDWEDASAYKESP